MLFCGALLFTTIVICALHNSYSSESVTQMIARHNPELATFARLKLSKIPETIKAGQRKIPETIGSFFRVAATVGPATVDRFREFSNSDPLDPIQRFGSDLEKALLSCGDAFHDACPEMAVTPHERQLFDTIPALDGLRAAFAASECLIHPCSDALVAFSQHLMFRGDKALLVRHELAAGPSRILLPLSVADEGSV